MLEGLCNYTGRSVRWKNIKESNVMAPGLKGQTVMGQMVGQGSNRQESEGHGSKGPGLKGRLPQFFNNFPIIWSILDAK